MLTIGIDFGTTNCSASCWRDDRLEMIPLEGDREVMPSTICITQDAELLLGTAAIERYLSEVGQVRIRYAFTDLREMSSHFSRSSDDPYIDTSSNFVTAKPASDAEIDMPARLFQSLKTALRDPDFNGSTIYGRYYAIEELIALVLGHIRQAAERHLGEPVQAAVIGRPVSYANQGLLPSTTAERVEQTACERMLAAARIAGFTHAALELEPVAATWHLQRNMAADDHALVFDFGGGTLDLAMVRVTEMGQPTILATHGILLGGDDFDSALMEHAILKHFGAGTTLGPKELPFPHNLLEPLLHWQTISLLATPTNAAHIASIKRQSNSPQTIANLQTLVHEGLGFRLFQLIEAAKQRLSVEREAKVQLDAKNLDIDETITRGQFVAAITDALGDIEDALRDVILRGEVGAQELDAVVMTGGSSLVPVVQRMVQRFFGDERVRVADPFTSISAGLGLIAGQNPELVSVVDFEAAATLRRIQAEAITIGERVAFYRGGKPCTGMVVGRAGKHLHDATLLIEFWDPEIEAYASTMRHETKVDRLEASRRDVLAD